jgi:hypothetical protein
MMMLQMPRRRNQAIEEALEFIPRHSSPEKIRKLEGVEHTWSRDCKPTWKVICAHNTSSQITSMAIVLAIICKAAALSRKCTSEVGVIHSSSLQLLPQQGTPAALDAFLA